MTATLELIGVAGPEHLQDEAEASTIELEIRQECSDLGDVSDVRLPRWGDDKAGCAYVDFEFGSDAARAKKALDNRKYAGRLVRAVLTGAAGSEDDVAIAAEAKVAMHAEWKAARKADEAAAKEAAAAAKAAKEAEEAAERKVAEEEYQKRVVDQMGAMDEEQQEEALIEERRRRRAEIAARFKEQQTPTEAAAAGDAPPSTAPSASEPGPEAAEAGLKRAADEPAEDAEAAAKLPRTDGASEPS